MALKEVMWLTKKKMGFGIICMETQQHVISIIKIKSNRLQVNLYLKSYYVPQVLFQDTDNFSLIFNNPSSSSIFARVKLLDKNKNIVGSEFSKLKRFETKIFNFDNSQTHFIKIESNLIFCRPIIKKVYKNSYDIFHG